MRIGAASDVAGPGLSGLGRDPPTGVTRAKEPNGAKESEGAKEPRGAKGAGAPEGVDPAKWAEADGVAKEFETMFMDLVVKGMRQTAKPEDQSNAGEIYSGLLDTEYSKSMTGAQDFGVRDLILDWMKTNDPAFAGLRSGGAAGGSAREGGALALEKARGAALEAYRAQAKLPK